LIRLSLFGPVSLRTDGREIRVKSLKLRAMLGYVALTDSCKETRERLVGLLWSESGEAQARAVLRQVIHEMREIFDDAGSRGLQISAQEIGFDRETVEVDVWNVINAAEAGEAHPLLLDRPRLADELMAGLEDLDPAFRFWLLAKRTSLGDRLSRALETAIIQSTSRPHKEGDLAEAILNLDPTHEEACRHLMRARARTGRTAHALRAYKVLWDLLDEDYGMEPSSATQQLVAEIKMGVYGSEVQTPADSALPVLEGSRTTPSPGIDGKGQQKLLLLVLPTDVKQIDPNKMHLVLGFRQLLIASLVKFREWQVTDVPLSTGHADLEKGSLYEIQLFAHHNDNCIQLTIMLKEVDTGFYIWSDGFELSLDNWFDSQKRVVRRIAMSLNVYLSADRMRRYSSVPDISLSVYDRWLRCQTLVRTFDPQHWQRLTQQFVEIIRVAPDFAPACCGLADMHTIEHIAHPGIFRSQDREVKALELARRAVQIDPAAVHAHRSVAWAHAMAKQYSQAELHIQVACELNRSDSWTAISGALLLAFCGKTEQALALSETALDLMLSPSRTHWAYQVDIQFLGGKYEAAISAADQAQDILWGVAAWRTAALAHLGFMADAAAEGERFLSRVRANWFGLEPPADAAIVRWLLHLYPIRQPADWERLRDGLRAAGLPTEGVRYDSWRASERVEEHRVANLTANSTR
jgi:DNA-binding SARP family transcriptional activator/TolB-like protein